MDNYSIRNHNNRLVIKFEHCGDNFTLKVPHHSKWLSIIAFLKNRGFEIAENPTYKKHYPILSKFHKIGFKKDVALLLEITPSSIKFEFGNIKNLWKGISQGFWNEPSDKRYAKLSYLEDVAVKFESYKLFDFCKQFNLLFIKEDFDLSPTEFIIKKLQENTHIHGKVECLNDIKKSITENSYDWTHNSYDKDGKKIICGDKKYFYSYRNKRLCVGEAWHNINNMWWIIVGNKLYNIASHDLFDYEKDLPRKQQPDKSYIEKLLKKYEGIRDYKKCMNIQNYHKKLLKQ